MISSADLTRLKALPLGLNPQPLRRGTTHLYERIADAVSLALGEDALVSGDYTIHTTILAEAQNAAQKALSESLAARRCWEFESCHPPAPAPPDR